MVRVSLFLLGVLCLSLGPIAAAGESVCPPGSQSATIRVLAHVSAPVGVTDSGEGYVDVWGSGESEPQVAVSGGSVELRGERRGIPPVASSSKCVRSSVDLTPMIDARVVRDTVVVSVIYLDQ